MAGVAGAVGEKRVHLVEVVVEEGRRRCSLATVVTVVERSGCNLGVRSREMTEAGQSQVRSVEVEIQEMLGEVVGT